jgi:glycosidase
VTAAAGTLAAGSYSGKISVTATGATNSPAAVAVTLTVTSLPAVENHPDLRRRVIYQIITDRFFNNDTSTQNPPQSPNMFDATKTNWQFYWGGNLAGIQAQLPYLQTLGVGAIWISPPVDNINVPFVSNGVSYAPYHGYSGHDYKRIEEHFGNVDNSWTAFDNLIAAAHAANIQVIVDFAGNDSNPSGGGENGALYDNGDKLTDFASDTVVISATGTGTYYHHNPGISNWEDRYQLQYGTLEGLSDFAQESAPVDSYLKSSLSLFLQHGVDGFRLDAVKHTNWGWQYTEENSIQSYASSGSSYVNSPLAAVPYVFGEWMENLSDSLYMDSAKWSNRSGIEILNYPLYYDVASAFATGGSFNTVDSDVTNEQSSFANIDDLVMFIDNHDNPRLQSQGATTNQLNEALVFDIACSGVPIVYYGDEQYLHNDTNNGSANGGDPYSRPWMTAFDTTTTAAQAVRYMAALRSSNLALAYGSMMQRWKNNDVYIFERQFNDSIVLVAINKSESNDQAISGLYTNLPAGTYTDYLNGLLGGMSLTVTSSSSGSGNAASNFTLPKHTVAVWQMKGGTAAQAAAVTPRVGHPGMHAAITGIGFGSIAGGVSLDGNAAAIVSWSDDTVVFSVPAITAGAHTITMATSAASPNSVSTPSAFTFTVLEAPLVPVTFTLNGAPALSGTEQYFVTGDTVELGSNATDFNDAQGPLLIPSAGNPSVATGASPLITVPLPAGQTVHLRFFKVPQGATTPSQQESSTHTYTVPTSGTDARTITWIN